MTVGAWANALSGARATPSAPCESMKCRRSNSTRARRIEEVGIKIGAGSSSTDARAAGPRRTVDDLHAFSARART